eukprot:scaffold155271_cov20-Tisochrysis_lutea.AAC.3
MAFLIRKSMSSNESSCVFLSLFPHIGRHCSLAKGTAALKMGAALSSRALSKEPKPLAWSLQ